MVSNWSSFRGRAIAYVDEIRWEHGQVLIEEVDLAGVDSCGDGLSDLMRRSALNHIKSRPAVLGLSAGGGADEKRVLHLSLEVVLLDVVGEHGWNLPGGRILAH